MASQTPSRRPGAPLVPGPRPARARDRVRAAVLEHLTDGSYADLTYEGIAASSGVAKTTLYRHWPSKAELVFDLVLHDRELPSLADRGSLEADIDALAERLVEFVDGGPAGRVFVGVLADVARDPETRARFVDTFVVAAQPLIAATLRRIENHTGRPIPLPVEDVQAVLVGSVVCWAAVAGLDAPETRRRTTRLIRVLVAIEG